MTTRELLEVLNNTKTAKAYERACNPPSPPPPPPLPPIDWEERKMEKNKIMFKYLKILSACFFGIMLFLISPVFIAYHNVGRSLMMGLPPMMFIGLSWMGGAWYAWDKDQYIFMGLTLGAMPIRIGIGLLWAAIVIKLPNIDQIAFALGMMLFWVAFTIPEIAMLIEFSKKLPRHGEQLEP